MQVSILEKQYSVVVSPKRFIKDKVVLGSNSITVFQAEDSRKHPKTIFENWLKEYSRKIITDRTKMLAKENNFEFKKISIREQSTRWGSCSSEKNLNFNWKLILGPQKVLDYVIVHELSHTVEMNHSKAFWLVVQKVMPDYLTYRNWLRVNGNSLKID